MKRILIICHFILAAGCSDSEWSRKSSEIQEKHESIAVNHDSRIPKVSSELSLLISSDIQTIARDALLRFASTYTYNRAFYLTGYSYVEFYSDSKWNQGKLEVNYDRFDRGEGIYEPSVREAFGDYDTFPESVRKVVLNKPGPKPDGVRHLLPLGIKSIAWSKQQRKVQITICGGRMPWDSFTFLYQVEDDGILKFICSEVIGCSSPEGYFITETIKQEN